MASPWCYIYTEALGALEMDGNRGQVQSRSAYGSMGLAVRYTLSFLGHLAEGRREYISPAQTLVFR